MIRTMACHKLVNIVQLISSESSLSSSRLFDLLNTAADELPTHASLLEAAVGPFVAAAILRHAPAGGQPSTVTHHLGPVYNSSCPLMYLIWAGESAHAGHGRGLVESIYMCY